MYETKFGGIWFEDRYADLKYPSKLTETLEQIFRQLVSRILELEDTVKNLKLDK
jgi:hypothetical protein